MRLTWSTPGAKILETGVDNGVLYPPSGLGVPWVGLITVDEAVLGGETESLYYNGDKYLDFVANEDFQAIVSAFSAPDEFAECNGMKQLAAGLFATGQRRSRFGMSYRTLIGNDISGLDAGYKLHLVYNCVAGPSGKTNQTQGENPEPTTLQWTVNSVPPRATAYKPTAHFVVDSTKTDPEKLSELEDLLYGTDSTSPGLPSQDLVIATLS